MLWKPSQCKTKLAARPRPPYRGQEEEKEEEGELCYLHLQGFEAGPSRHRYLQQGHVYHELFRERHLRAYCCRGQPPCPLQPEVNDHQPRDPDRCPSSPARRVGQARCLRRNKGCHQIHQLQVDLNLIQQKKRPSSGPPHFP